jgi:hypothetical protein
MRTTIAVMDSSSAPFLFLQSIHAPLLRAKETRQPQLALPLSYGVGDNKVGI